ncbi:MAG: hypothetical protein AAFQ11_13395, partial [Pseudomonadota bacterium]
RAKPCKRQRAHTDNRDTADNRTCYQHKYPTLSQNSWIRVADGRKRALNSSGCIAGEIEVVP